jgi:MFS family permease
LPGRLRHGAALVADRSQEPLASHTSGTFWKYWTALTVSTTGSGVSVVAIPLLALIVLHASNLQMGLLAAASYVGTVLIGLPSGVIAQQFPLRFLQVSLDGVRAVAMLSVPLAAWLGFLSVPFLLVVAFLAGLAGNLYDVANMSYLPRLVRKEELAARNGLLSGTISATELTGQALGGVLVQIVGAPFSILLDAATYVFSAIVLGQIPVAGRAAQPATRTLFARQIAVGVKYVLRHPVMRPSVIAAAALSFAGGAILAAAPPFLVRTLGLPPGWVGVVLALEGVGALAGAAVCGKLIRRYGSARALVLASATGALLSLAMPLATTSAAVVIFGVGLALLNVSVTIFSIVTRTHRQAISPPDLLSRVMASVRFISWSMIPVGGLVAGSIAQVWGPRAGLAVATVAALIAPVAVLSSRIRTLREMTDCEHADASLAC